MIQWCLSTIHFRGKHRLNMCLRFPFSLDLKKIQLYTYMNWNVKIVMFCMFVTHNHSANYKRAKGEGGRWQCPVVPLAILVYESFSRIHDSPSIICSGCKDSELSTTITIFFKNTALKKGFFFARWSIMMFRSICDAAADAVVYWYQLSSAVCLICFLKKKFIIH